MFRIWFSGIGEDDWYGSLIIRDDKTTKADKLALCVCKTILGTGKIRLSRLGDTIFEVLADGKPAGFVKIEYL